MTLSASFLIFSEVCDKIEKTTKRNEIIDIVISLFNKIPVKELPYAIVLLSGHIFPPWENKVLNISWRSIYKVIKRITKVTSSEFSHYFSKSGDVGQAIQDIFESKNIGPERGLFETYLTISEIQEIFYKIAETKGKDSVKRKLAILEALYRRATPKEAKYLTKILLGDLRIGVGEGILELAIAKKYNLNLKDVQQSHMIYGDLGSVMKKIIDCGKECITKATIQLFHPLRPMLADSATKGEEILERHGGVSALEYKLDGARIQIHKDGNQVRIFSRRLTDITESLSDFAQKIKKHRISKFVIEGEVIAVSSEGKPYPFQYLMRRFRRLESDLLIKQKIPLQYYFFDVLYFKDKDLLKEPYEIRRTILETEFQNLNVIPRVITNDPSIIEDFFNEAITQGHEGLVAKMLHSQYHPGKRRKQWLKYKRTLEPLDVVIVAAQFGYGRRVKWLSDYDLAVRDPKTNEYLVIGKTFKGLTDEEFKLITKELLKLKIKQIHGKVFVKPQIVVEVIYDEIQKSQQYKSGFALRFARIKNIRFDKSVDEIDTIDKVRKIYEKQFKYKAKFNDSV